LTSEHLRRNAAHFDEVSYDDLVKSGEGGTKLRRSLVTRPAKPSAADRDKTKSYGSGLEPLVIRCRGETL
jgi:hypothetical protein